MSKGIGRNKVVKEKKAINTDSYKVGEREWFIPFNVPSSKNGRQIVTFNSGIRGSIKSKGTKAYYDKACWHYKKWKDDFRNTIRGLKLQPPFTIEYTFIRSTAHDFDYTNKCDTVQDIMVECGWLKDDNYTIIIPYFGEPIFDKYNAGVKIRILLKKPIHE